MSFDDAINAWVTVKEAQREARNHGARVWQEDARLIGVISPEDGALAAEDIAKVNPDGTLLGGHLLAWLGY